MDGKSGAGRPDLRKVLTTGSPEVAFADKAKPAGRRYLLSPERKSSWRTGRAAAAQVSPPRRINLKPSLPRNSNRKTDRARGRGRGCGAHARRTGAGETTVVSDRSASCGNHRLSESDERDSADNENSSSSRAHGGGWIILVRQHRNGRDAENPGNEHLEEGPGEDPQEIQGCRLGSEPDIQRLY